MWKIYWGICIRKKCPYIINIRLKKINWKIWKQNWWTQQFIFLKRVRFLIKNKFINIFRKRYENKIWNKNSEYNIKITRKIWQSYIWIIWIKQKKFRKRTRIISSIKVNYIIRSLEKIRKKKF